LEPFWKISSKRMRSKQQKKRRKRRIREEKTREERGQTDGQDETILGQHKFSFS